MKKRQYVFKKTISVFLSLTIAGSSFLGLLAGNFRLIDYLDLKSAITAKADEPSDVAFYRYNELVGVYKTDYTDTDSIYYKIGDDGNWTEYSHPFAIPAYTQAVVYARLGGNGSVIGDTFTTSKLAIGKYTESETDFTISYNNAEYGYTRTYDGKTKQWSFSTERRVFRYNNIAYVEFPDGNELPFIRTSQTEYVNEITGYTLTLGNNNSIIVDTGEYKYVYSGAQSRISYVEDKCGNRINIGEDADLEYWYINVDSDYKYVGEEVYDLFGPTDEFSGDKEFLYSTVTDPNSNTFEYVSNTNYGIIKVVDQAGVYLSRYKYDSQNRIIKNLDKNISYDSDGRVSRIEYDGGDFTAYSYDDENMTYSVTNAIGQTITTVYNDAFLPTEYTDEYGNTTTYTYDSDFNVISESSDGITTTYTYNSSGCLLSSSSTDGSVSSNTYNNDNQLIRSYDGTNYTYYSYNASGDYSVIATLKEDYSGQIPQIYDSALTCFDKIEYNYDTDGRISTLYDYKNDRYETYTYDTYGNQTGITAKKISDDSTTSQTSYTYDGLGNILTTTDNNEQTSYVYDEAGRTLRVNDNGKITRTLYDNLGRIVREIGPEDYNSYYDGLPNSNTYSLSGGHEYTYNNDNQLVSETNRYGVETLYSYHSNGVKASEDFLGYGCDYNELGQITKMVRPDGNVYCNFIYDNKNRLIKKKYALQRNHYNFINYYYDNDNNLTSQGFKKYGESEVTQFEYTYDNDGNLVTKTDYINNQYTEYDSDGNYTVYNIVENNGVTSNVFAYSYTNTEDTVDDLTGLTVPASESFAYAGNNTLNVIYGEDEKVYSLNSSELFNLNSYETAGGDYVNEYVAPDDSDILSYSNQYDSNGNVTTKAISIYGSNTVNRSVVNQYDNKNRIVSTSYNGETSDYAYNQYGFIDYSEHSKDNLYYNYSYTSFNSFYNISVDLKAEYQENDHNQRTLISATHFNYHSYDSDKLTAVENDSVTTDKAGNITAIGSRQHTWTNLRQLESVTYGNNTYTYTYDENGTRTSKTAGGVKTDYYTKNGNIIVQTDGTNTWCFQYDEGEDLIGFLYNGAQYYYLTNQMNDVIGIINSDGDIIAEYWYDDWGGLYAVDKPSSNTTAENTIADTNPMLYRGYYYDYETQYYYLQSRYYYPEICRFINADYPEMMYTTKDEAYGGTNAYTYCYNDPVNRVDKDGNRSYTLKYCSQEWVVKFLRKFVSYANDKTTSIISFKKIPGVKVELFSVISYSVGGLGLFSLNNKGELTVSFGGISISSMKKTATVSATIKYKNCNVGVFIGISKWYVNFGYYVYSSSQYGSQSIKVGLKLSISIHIAYVAAFIGATYAVRCFCPALAPLPTIIKKLYTTPLGLSTQALILSAAIYSYVM